MGKGDVCRDIEVVLGEYLPKPARREKVALRRSKDTVYIFRPGLSLIRPWLCVKKTIHIN
jgi:hypothetical protein